MLKYEGNIGYPPAHGILMQIDTSLSVYAVLHHDFDDGVTPSGFVIWLSTDKIYGCYNFSLPGSVKVSGRRASIELDGLYIPDICLDAFNAATRGFAFESEPGTSYLTISYGGNEANFVVRRSGNDVSIAGDEEGWCHIGAEPPLGVL